MIPNRIPGNEPDADDMSTEPGVASPGGAADHDLPEDEAENLGGFAEQQDHPADAPPT